MELIAQVSVLSMFTSKMAWSGGKNNKVNTVLPAMLQIMALEDVKKDCVIQSTCMANKGFYTL